ncbi:MAG TPA: hypothetical protein VIC26_12590 [Marinagarivorans sp.]
MLLLPLGLMLILTATIILCMPKLRYAEQTTPKHRESPEQRATRARLEQLSLMAKPAMLAGSIMIVTAAAGRLLGL